VTGAREFLLTAMAVTVSLALPVAAQAETHIVTMAQVAFAPAAITVRVGDTVEWDNRDIVAHTATAKEASFDVNVVPNRRGSAVLETAGTFSYICRYHPNMRGQITVEP
jgi:plastocyanin